MLHIHGSGKLITSKWKKLYRDEIKLTGGPIFQHCGKKLNIGDYVGYHWPWQDEGSMCKQCWEDKINGITTGTSKTAILYNRTM